MTLEKREIAGDDQDALRAGRFESGVDAAERAALRHEIGVNRDAEVIEPSVGRADDEDLAGHLLQDLQLTDDDGAAADDEAALVPAAEPARAPARENRGGDVGTRRGQTGIHLHPLE